MKLEVGKFYRTRDGRKVGPMVATGHIDSNMAFNCVDGCGWTLHGTEYNYAESSNDLIAEWQEEPEGIDYKGLLREAVKKQADSLVDLVNKADYHIDATTRARILDTAKQAVTKDRAATHGKPEDTFGALAAVWSARLGQELTPAQVCIMLIDLKTCRAWGNPKHEDNWVDMAGYAACGAEVAK